MAIRSIRKYGNPVLRKKCSPVRRVGKQEIIIFEDMVETMRAKKGVGLAAPQIGINKELIVADVGDGVIKLANPRILKRKGKSILEEGCLSLPGIKVIVKRAREIVLEGINEKNQKVNVKTAELPAHVFQHEIDHLKGRLIVDRIGIIDKIKIRDKLKELKRMTKE